MEYSQDSEKFFSEENYEGGGGKGSRRGCDPRISKQGNEKKETMKKNDGTQIKNGCR